MFAALARAAELRLGNFNVQGLANTTWALSRLANWTGAWGLLKHMSCTGQSSSLTWVEEFGTLLMECEQRGLMDYGMKFSQGLELCD